MAELWLVLQDGSRTCLERMKVAGYLWKQESVRKKKWPLLVKWALDEVCKTYNRKARSRPPCEVCGQLWQLLSVMLESIATSGVEIWAGETSPSAHFFQSVCDVLNEASTPESDSSSIPSVCHVLKCLDSILTAPMLPPSLHKYETVVLLLQSLLDLAVCSLKSYSTMDYPLADIFQTLEQLLKYFVYLQGSHGNPKKIFTSICHQLLPSVLRVKYKCSAFIQKADFSHFCDRTKSQIEKLLLVLFSQDHLAEFTSAVAVADVSGSSQKRSATSYVRVLFEALTKMAAAAPKGDEMELAEDQSAVIEVLPELYRCFLYQNRQEGLVSKAVEFKFLKKLLVLLGIEHPSSGSSAEESHSASAMEAGEALDLEQILRDLLASMDVDSEKSDTNQRSVLNALRKCLELVWMYDVYQVAEDRSSGSEQFDTLRLLSMKILKELQNNCMVESFDCLAMVMRLNHKLLEPWLPSLLLFLVATHHSRDRDTLDQECITIFAKLRQLPQLVTKVLEALNLLREITTLPVSTSPTFAPSTEQLFAEHVSKLPPGQCTEVLELLISHLHDEITKLESGVRLGSSLPSLERAADVLRLSLSHLPASLWSSKQKDKAMQLLQSLISDVVLPLLTACTTHDFNARLSSVALLLSSECTNLLAHLHYLSPSLLPCQRSLEMVWNEELNILVPEQWSGVLVSIDKLNSLGRYLLYRMALLELRFYLSESSATSSQLLVFILSDPPPFSDGTVVTWSGQLLDLVKENEHVGYWNLLLSQLPFIYSHMTKEHLETVAREMVKAVLSVGEGNDGAVVEQDHGKPTGMSKVDLISVFLESEGFVEMNVLQELIMKKFCTNLSSLVRRSLPNPLRRALKTTSSAEPPQEELTTSLCTVLQHSVETLHDPPAKETAAAMSDSLFNKINMPLVHQLISSFPLGSLSQVTLLQSLTFFTVLHIATTQLMHDEEYQGEAAAQLEELNYFLSWMVHSLTVSEREKKAKLTRSSKRKRRSSTTELSEAEPSAAATLLNLLTLYTYEHMALIQSLGVTASLLASTLLAMEITVSALTKLGDYPDELLEKVVVDLQRKPKDGSASPSVRVAKKCLYSIANVSCKLLSSSSKHHGDGTDSEKSSLSVLLEHTVAAMEKFMRKRKKPVTTDSTTPLEVVHEHPVLISTLALLLHQNPQLVSARHAEIISLLCGSSEESPAMLVEEPYAQFELFCGVMDLLSLPAVTARLHSSSPAIHDEEGEDTQGMEITSKEIEQGSHVGSESPLLLSWKRLQSVLGCTLSEALRLKDHDSYQLLHCLELSCGIKKSSQFQIRRRVDIFSAMCVQLSRTMSMLLTAASDKELHFIIEQLLCIKIHEHLSVSSVMSFCFSWCVVIGNTKLPQEKRSLIRKYLQRVLLTCQSIIAQHSSDIFAISLTIQLVARLVSIPTSVGLDHTSVLLALELCVFASKLQAAASHYVTASLVVAETDLLLGVLKQHISVATSAPSPIITAVNKLLGTVIQLGQAAAATQTEISGLSSDAPGPTLLEVCIHCATKLSRLMEMLSQKASFTKFAVYIVHVFLTSSQGATLNKDIKTALLSGVFNLLKLCTSNDIAFIKASTDPATRDSFQTLLDEYQRYHKFGGRV